MRGAAGAHLGGVDVEDTGVVGLAAVGVVLHHLAIELVAVLVGSLPRDADTAVHMQGALERLIGLQADDGLLLGMLVVDVARGMAADAGNGLGVHIQDTTLLALLQEQVKHLAPQVLRALRRAGEELVITVVRGVVPLDEVADVNLVLPNTALEAFPCCVLHLCNHAPLALIGEARALRGMRAPGTKNAL